MGFRHTGGDTRAAIALARDDHAVERRDEPRVVCERLQATRLGSGSRSSRTHFELRPVGHAVYEAFAIAVRAVFFLMLVLVPSDVGQPL